MKTKIAIFGSTGSIGTSTLEIIKKNFKNFSVELLSAKNNYKKLISQAIKFRAKNVIIYNEKYFYYVNKKLKKFNTKVFTEKTSLDKIIKNKIDYSMISVVGIAGLKPTLDAIPISNKILIANKESIVCGWELIKKKIQQYKTKLIPVDSEHFSIMNLVNEIPDKEISEIIITASGGPFLKLPTNKLKNVKPSQAIKHPKWNMGNKISIDSANLMNKVFETIEAYHLFNFQLKKYKIMIHPQSLVHGIIKFKNGLIKMLLHDTDMKIPISCALYGDSYSKKNIHKTLNEKELSKLRFYKVDKKKFPAVNLVKKYLLKGKMGPTILNGANEELVKMFLNEKIKFTDIVQILNELLKVKGFSKFAKKNPKVLRDIYTCDKWARLKTISISVRYFNV